MLGSMSVNQNNNIQDLLISSCLNSAFSYNSMFTRVHTEPGNPGKVVNLKQAFSGPGIAWILGVLGDWSGNRREF